MLEVTKISSKGQITIPIELRKKLNLVSGGKLAFIEGDDGKVYVVNSSMLALKTAQNAFSGAAKNADVKNEDALLEIIKESREDWIMQVMVDSNTLLSALLFPNGAAAKAFEKCIQNYDLIICTYVIDECKRVVRKKFPKYI